MTLRRAEHECSEVALCQQICLPVDEVEWQPSLRAMLSGKRSLPPPIDGWLRGYRHSSLVREEAQWYVSFFFVYPKPNPQAQSLKP